MSAFPSHPDQLTTNWLSEQLGTNIDQFHVELLGEGGGLLGMVTRVHLEEGGSQRTVIAKFPTPTEENRAVATVYDMYGREYRFYTQVAPTVPLRTPECYAAHFDPGTSDFVLLLEDLKGYRLGDQVTGCSLDEARQIIQGIASLHRNTWQPDHITEIKQHDMPYQREGMKAGFQAGLPVVQDLFAHLLDEEARTRLPTVPDHVDSLLDRIHDGPLVIAHGDLRLDNIFFSDDDIALVDYQAVCKAAPEHDIAYFVTQSLGDDVRNAEDWLAFYHGQLTSEGINYDLETSRRRYRLCAMYFVCYAVIIAGTLDPANERGRQLAETLLGNSLKSLRELDAYELIKQDPN